MAVLSIFRMLMGGLFGKSATKLYPMVPKEAFAATRGHIEIEIEKCIFCGQCARKCPTGAITVSKNDKNWSISPCACIQCNCCVEVCPKKCLLMDNQLPEAVYQPSNRVVTLPTESTPDA